MSNWAKFRTGAWRMAMKPAVARPRRIGLLFVHGMGEQQRFEHLRSSVAEFAELMIAEDDAAQVSVVDRTGDWQVPPGEPAMNGDAPITLSVKRTPDKQPAAAEQNIRFECHEVWWADLGARAGLADTIAFWFWGLGQWAAPIYRSVDLAGVGKSADEDLRPPKTTMPRSIAGDLIHEPLARFKLLLAGIAALLTLVTWSLAKRLLGALFGKAPSPSLIVQFVGDVRTYQQRAAPGQARISDPGRPLRVGIRRRMVTEMVAMAARGYDEWFVVAHSLGTVLAYNGLTEFGHTLPNYLPEKQWRSLPDHFKRDDECRLRPPDEISAMMPARPGWLAYEDVVNRLKLFEGLSGVITFGSPLDKFAGLWPRIVATADDRKMEAFPGQVHMAESGRTT